MSTREQLEAEIKRAEELIAAYKSIGPAGFYGVLSIGTVIAHAKDVLGMGDEKSMQNCIKMMKGLE